jgi:hypothetical protein
MSARLELKSAGGESGSPARQPPRLADQLSHASARFGIVANERTSPQPSGITASTAVLPHRRDSTPDIRCESDVSARQRSRVGARWGNLRPIFLAEISNGEVITN